MTRLSVTVPMQVAPLTPCSHAQPLPPLVNAAYSLASAMRDMADAIEANPEVVEDAADELGRDFIQDRLPPYPSSIAPKGEVPTLTSQICCRIPVRSPAPLCPLESSPPCFGHA